MSTYSDIYLYSYAYLNMYHTCASFKAISFQLQVCKEAPILTLLTRGGVEVDFLPPVVSN